MNPVLNHNKDKAHESSYLEIFQDKPSLWDKVGNSHSTQLPTCRNVRKRTRVQQASHHSQKGSVCLRQQYEPRAEGDKIMVGSILLNARVALCKILLIIPDFHGTEPAAYALFTELIKAQRCIFVVSKILFNTFYNQQINTFNNMGKYGQLFLIMLQSLRMFIFQKPFK